MVAKEIYNLNRENRIGEISFILNIFKTEFIFK